LLPTYSEKQIKYLGRALQDHLITKDAQFAALLDLSGSIIVKRDNGRVDYDFESIAVLAASNFSAVKAIAQRIGETQFSLLFHKGKKGNIHLNEVMRGYLLITIFGKEVSVGNLRLMVEDTVKQVRRINQHFIANAKNRPSESTLPQIPTSTSPARLKKKREFVLRRLMRRLRRKFLPQ
jgi:predicted regulator of Ras-like GTPase activity (Roadblock/LC7/MglB family)